jgi:RimJ/RimL family protein N-acetyltransferase
MRAQAVPLPEKPRRVTLPCARRFADYWTILRPLESGDRERLLAFFASHTPETIRSRYGYVFREMTSERAAALVSVDQTRDCAIGVFEITLTETNLIAVGRYCLTKSGDAAELAFVVREDRRDLGIATALLDALMTIALERGLGRLLAQVSYDNAAMLAVFRRAGARIAEIPAAGSMFAELRLNKATRRAAAPATRAAPSAH